MSLHLNVHLAGASSAQCMPDDRHATVPLFSCMCLLSVEWRQSPPNLLNLVIHDSAVLHTEAC